MNWSSTFSWLWQQSRGYRWGLAGNALLGCLRVAASLLFVAISKHLIDIATGVASGSLWLWAGILIACPVVQLGFGALNLRLENAQDISMRNSLSLRMYNHLLRMQWQGPTQMLSGDLTERLTQDVATVSSTVCREIPFAVISLVQLLGAFAFFMWLSPKLALLMVAVMPIALLLSKRFIDRTHAVTSEMRRLDGRLQQTMQESLRHHVMVKALQLVDYFTSRVEAVQSDMALQVKRRTVLSIQGRVIVQLGFSAGYVLAFLWGVWGLSTAAITFGTMAAFLQLVSRIQQPTVSLSRQVPVIANVTASIQRLRELMDVPAEDAVANLSFTAPVGIRIEGLSFAYPEGERMVYENFSCHFRPGTATVVMGPSGAGKSTLLRLLLGLVKPTAGSIIYYDRDYAYEAGPALRGNIGYVPQGNTLISGTVRENLTMGTAGISDKKIQQALTLAVADFANSLPQGLDTLCGEDGFGLSEGQAQRIAIARALLRESSVLLLDEPTAALDSATASRLIANLRSLPDKTIIIITHNRDLASQIPTLQIGI